MRVLSLFRQTAAAALAVVVACAGDGSDPEALENRAPDDDAHELAPRAQASSAPALTPEPESIPQAQSDKGFDQPFVVMSMNVRIPASSDTEERAWSVRKGLINGMVRRFGGGNGPEVIGVQELRVATLPELHALLSNYAYYAVNRGDGEIIAIFVRTSRFEMLETGFRNTTNSERDDLCTIRDEEDHADRPIMYVRLADRQTGRITYVYNTHYPSKNSCERKQMSKIVADYVAGRGDKSAPLVLVGDLNDGVNGDGSLNDSYARLLNYTGLHNAYADVHPLNAASEFTSTTNGWQKALRHYKMIDHVLISPGIGVRDAYVDKTMFTSDGAVVDCPVVTNGLCGNDMSVNSLRLYSDHWAAWAVLWEP